MKWLKKSDFKIGVIGAGSWGSALAILLSGKTYIVDLWAHNEDHVHRLQQDRENKKYLPGCSFPSSLKISSDIEKTVRGSDVIVMVVPSHVYRDVFRKIVPFLEKECRIVSAVKGMENTSLKTMTQVMEDVLHQDFGGTFDVELGVLSGPSFAEEVANNVPTAVTVGFNNLSVAREIQEIFVTDTFRVYASQDVIGLEISASLKNIIAIAAGVCEGLGYGLNTRAALITRGLAEMRRFGIALRADASTFSGLSGLGDLVLTCTGNLSRNRNVGLKLGQGKTLEEILDEMEMVAEGIMTTKSVHDLAKAMRVDMPILEQVYEIIYNKKDCSLAVSDLLKRELKVE